MLVVVALLLVLKLLRLLQRRREAGR